MILTASAAIIFSIVFSLIKKFSLKQNIVITLFTLFLVVVLEGIVGFPSLSSFLRNGLNNINPRIQLTPFDEGLGLTERLNIILFIPVGFFFTLLMKKGRSFFHVVVLGFLFSLFIEISQIFTFARVTDITDLITNTLGTAIGFLLYKLFRVKMKVEILSIMELIMYIMTIGIICFIST